MTVILISLASVLVTPQSFPYDLHILHALIKSPILCQVEYSLFLLNRRTRIQLPPRDVSAIAAISTPSLGERRESRNIKYAALLTARRVDPGPNIVLMCRLKYVRRILNGSPRTPYSVASRKSSRDMLQQPLLSPIGTFVGDLPYFPPSLLFVSQ